MTIIRDEKVFAQEFNLVTKLIRLDAKLPQQVFATNFPAFLFFEFDRILFDHFGQMLIQLLKSLQEPSATWITLDPNPKSYFARLFNHFGSAIVDASDSKQQYIDFLMYSADGNPAEALMRRPITAAVFPTDSKWCVYADAKAELGIIACADEQIKHQVTANAFGIIVRPIADALENPFGHGFTDRMLSTAAKALLVKNYSRKLQQGREHRKDMLE